MILFLAVLPLATALSIARLDYASFQGRVDNASQSVTYYNIPFAAPPIGELRFRPPQPPLNLTSSGLIDATKAGPSCMLDPKFFLNMLAHPSEDCLQLNVAVPANAKPGDNLPVIVHVLGGKFTDGYNSFPYGMSILL